MAMTGAGAVKAAAEEAQRDNYDASFHFLMAALHIADKSGDLPMVEVVSTMAYQLGSEVDAVKPQHHMSTIAAETRGQTPLFESIQIHCRAVLLRHRAETAQQQR